MRQRKLHLLNASSYTLINVLSEDKRAPRVIL
jgi:hypothetical protein